MLSLLSLAKCARLQTTRLTNSFSVILKTSTLVFHYGHKVKNNLQRNLFVHATKPFRPFVTQSKVSNVASCLHFKILRY